MSRDKDDAEVISLSSSDDETPALKRVKLEVQPHIKQESPVAAAKISPPAAPPRIDAVPKAHAPPPPAAQAPLPVDAVPKAIPHPAVQRRAPARKIEVAAAAAAQTWISDELENSALQAFIQYQIAQANGGPDSPPAELGAAPESNVYADGLQSRVAKLQKLLRRAAQDCRQAAYTPEERAKLPADKKLAWESKYRSTGEAAQEWPPRWLQRRTIAMLDLSASALPWPWTTAALDAVRSSAGSNSIAYADSDDDESDDEQLALEDALPESAPDPDVGLSAPAETDEGPIVLSAPAETDSVPEPWKVFERMLLDAARADPSTLVGGLETDLHVHGGARSQLVSGLLGETGLSATAYDERHTSTLGYLVRGGHI